jgi:hypothetical protein
MNLRQKCIQSYQETIRLADIPSDLRTSLKAHERVPKFIDNLAKEMRSIPNLDSVTIKMMVHDLTHLFITSVRTKADEMRMSDLERIRRQKEKDDLESLKAMTESAQGVEHVETTSKGETTRSTVEIS